MTISVCHCGFSAICQELVNNRIILLGDRASEDVESHEESLYEELAQSWGKRERAYGHSPEVKGISSTVMRIGV